LSVPDVLAAAKLAQGCRVLDVATGTGEAAAIVVPIVGDTGFVVGADISLEMVKSARVRQQQRNVLALSWSLADPRLLEGLFSDAGFQDIRVEQIRREGSVSSFDDYWAPIEEGVGQIPQAYRSLDAADRRSVREEVRARLARYESADGRLTMGVEMLIGSGQA
jgi:SAM-dependent methyltransferase